MHPRAFAIGIVCGLVLAVVPVTFMITFNGYFRSVAPTPDTQSAFIKSYNPQPLIERFACGNIGKMVPTPQGPSAGGSTSSAGVGFVSHHRTIDAYIEIDEEHWIPLMQALAKNVNNQLLLGGGEGGGAGKGITSRFYYQDGRSLGSVSIPPLLPYEWITNNFDRYPGCTPVQVSVYIDEVFVPKLPLDAVDQLSRITNRWDRNRHEGPTIELGNPSDISIMTERTQSAQNNR